MAGKIASSTASSGVHASVGSLALTLIYKSGKKKLAP